MVGRRKTHLNFRQSHGDQGTRTINRRGCCDLNCCNIFHRHIVGNGSPQQRGLKTACCCAVGTKTVYHGAIARRIA